ncbi:hypothetical protein [Candidatus Liberibacter sp.]|uniref:hypothetical protein n=1 Tax=Candidatus Liberibacter sp. TaxID=34022 RepID=UPI001C70C3A3|nr:hypothetical protein [Candidatus Liberibacter sp.]
MVVDEKVRANKNAIGFLKEHRNVVLRSVQKATKEIAEAFFPLVEYVLENKREVFINRVYGKDEHALNIFYDIPSDPNWKLTTVITMYFNNLMKNYVLDYNPCLTPNFYPMAKKLMKKLEENQNDKAA